MKYVLMIAFILLFTSVKAQEASWNGFEVKFKDGQVVKPGQYIVLGLGTGSNGDYSYIYKLSNNLDKKHFGQKMKIVKVVQKGSEKKGYRYIAAVEKAGKLKYDVLLEPALLTKEITITDN